MDKNIRHALRHVCVVHRDDEYLINALRLELLVLLDVHGRLRAARGSKRPGYTNLEEQVSVGATNDCRRTCIYSQRRSCQ